MAAPGRRRAAGLEQQYRAEDGNRHGRHGPPAGHPVSPRPGPAGPRHRQLRGIKDVRGAQSVSTSPAPGGGGVMAWRADGGTAPPEAGVYVPDEPTPSSYRSLQKQPRHRRRAFPVRLAFAIRSLYRRLGRRRRRLLALALVAVALLTALISVVIYLRPPPKSLVVATVPYWNLSYGT